MKNKEKQGKTRKNRGKQRKIRKNKEKQGFSKLFLSVRPSRVVRRDGVRPSSPVPYRGLISNSAKVAELEMRLSQVRLATGAIRHLSLAKKNKKRHWKEKTNGIRNELN